MKTAKQFLKATLTFFLSLSYQFMNAQSPVIDWQKCFGGSSNDGGLGIIKLSDGNYLHCGNTSSTDGDFNNNHGGYDAYLIKMDAGGNIIWQRTYGGTGDDGFITVLETTNGGLMALGTTTSNDGDVSGHHGDVDTWVVRFNAKGKILGQRCYGGNGDDEGVTIFQTQTSNYILCGYSNSTDGDINAYHGDYDAFVIKINKAGNILWSKTFGGTDFDELRYGLTADNKLMLIGTVISSDGDVEGSHGAIEGWVVKLNQAGGMLWQKCIGGSGDDYNNGIVLTPDGNIALGLSTNSLDGDVTESLGSFDAWFVKMNSGTGELIWQKSLGTPIEDAFFGLLCTTDGSLVGYGGSGVSADTALNTIEAYAAKVNADGQELWQRTYGGEDLEWMLYGIETNDGGILTSGFTFSSGGDVTGQHGEGDVWIVKLAADGERISSSYATGSVCELKCYPNPVSQSAVISFQLANDEKVSLKIYDLQGRWVTTISDDEMMEGAHQLKWNAIDENGNGLSAGIYLLRLETASASQATQLSVIR